MASVGERRIPVESRRKADGPQLRPSTARHGTNSPFLADLHADIPQIADRVTNIYSTHEIFIRPYVSAHIDVPGVSNVLIATNDEYAKHLARSLICQSTNSGPRPRYPCGRDEYTRGAFPRVAQGG